MVLCKLRVQPASFLILMDFCVGSSKVQLPDPCMCLVGFVLDCHAKGRRFVVWKAFNGPACAYDEMILLLCDDLPAAQSQTACM